MYSIDKTKDGWVLVLTPGSNVVFIKQVKRYIDALAILQTLGIHLEPADKLLAA